MALICSLVNAILPGKEEPSIQVEDFEAAITDSTGAQSFAKELQKADCCLFLYWQGELTTESLWLADCFNKDRAFSVG